MKNRTRTAWLAMVVGSAWAASPGWTGATARAEDAPEGYYRQPAVYGDTLVFTAEGDLWRVGLKGGIAQRLTSHPGTEGHAAFSPDGKTLAFSATYEGPGEVYTMPIEGGRPQRRTFEGGSAEVVGWTPDGKVLYTTESFSTLPDNQLATVDLAAGGRAPLPLSQASDGVFEPSGKTLFFTRLPFQGSSTKRYRGGTIQQLWKFTQGTEEAVPLTTNFPGTSKRPMWWDGRVYFISDRDGTMNLWSMSESGQDLRQLTRHQGWDVKGAALSQGQIVYQLGADLYRYDIAAQQSAPIPIRLATDLDQQREKWVRKPLDYLTSAHLSTNGDRVVLTARGQVFVAPVAQGRWVEATRSAEVRYRQARFLPDNKSLLALSDESGELEFVRLPANGVGQRERLTTDGKVFRFDGVPSPDGARIAYHDKNQELWLFNVSTKKTILVATSKAGEFEHLSWSPDSQWLAYVRGEDNTYSRIWIYQVAEDRATALTSDRVNSSSPAWSPDGKWLYFLSDRQLESVVASPWGPRQPEPFFDKPFKLYAVSLRAGGRSPFEPNDELHPAEPEKKDNPPAKNPSDTAAAKAGATDAQAALATNTVAAVPKAGDTNASVRVAIDWTNLQARLVVVPTPPGNYSDLSVNDKQLYWVSRERGGKATLMTLSISNDDPKPKALVEDVRSYELSLNGKKLLVRKGDEFHVVDATTAAPAKLEKAIDLRGWTFSLEPRQEWRQMFVESWRLMRDYFYDPKMHGVNWRGMLDKYLPLVQRVTDRAELNDLIGDMVGELSALHIFVQGGDFRDGPDRLDIACLGARWERDSRTGGYRVTRIYRTDPDYPERRAPLTRPGVEVLEGETIEAINGVPTLSTPHPEALLRNQAGKQVLLRVRGRDGQTARDVVVTPVDAGREVGLRYEDWEYSRRLLVEEKGNAQIGYVHLRAMGGRDIAQWARDFYPVFNRQGLIVDVRHNRGGNIDSWILEKLLRKAWFYWKPRVDNPVWNMQYAFRGHVVVLCDEQTASDGEAFSEGFKRLGLGKVIGTRTWGGEIWLSFDNWLVDRGIASAAEMGVYGPEGKWLIEGHGVEPDLVVDNPPHATFRGDDAQLLAAIKHLQDLIQRQPVPVPTPPPHPDKSVK